MDSDEFGSYEMRVDAIRSYSERVDSLIWSETASFYGDSPLYTFASLVDSAIRSSSASYEADYEPHSSTTSNLPSQELSLPDPHNNPYYQILTQHSNELSSGILRAPRIRWTITPPSHLKRFTFNELQTATRRFCPDGIVGTGGFGFVFKGWINEQTLAPAEPGTGMAIAVKRNKQESSQGFSEWSNEIKYLGQLRHPNIVTLLGYSSEHNHLILVYEFIGKGSLASHLYGSPSKCETLSWTIRKKVALDVAKVLAFLHSDEVRVICRDVKTSNILLDSNYNAKLGDFGLVRNGPEGYESYASTALINGPEGHESYVSTTLINGAERDESDVSTRVMGTLGYIAPEYIATGRLNKKNDVYGFGVVLLELMSGRHVLDRNRPKRKYPLVDWAKLLVDRKRISKVTDAIIKGQYTERWAKLFVDRKTISKVMDARIKGQYSEREAGRISHLAFQCLSREPKLRPTMDEVVRSLEHLQDSKTHR